MANAAPKLVLCGGIARLDLQRLFVLFDCRKFTYLGRYPKSLCDTASYRLDPQRLTELCDGFLYLPCSPQIVSPIIVRQPGIGLFDSVSRQSVSES